MQISNEELAALIQKGNTEYTEQLWCAVERFVRLKARKLKSHSAIGDTATDAEDLYQTGFIAMLRAVETFNPTQNNSFLSWLSYFLKQEFAQATGYLRHKHTADPTKSAVSLYTPVGEEEDTTLLELLPDPSAELDFFEAEHKAQIHHIGKQLNSAFDKLSPKQAETIRRRYFDGLTLQETADTMGISRQRAHQLEQAALERLKKDPNVQKLDEPRKTHPRKK